VTAAMGMGTGLDKFGNCFHDRYYDVGIAEGHALTFSAGLAAAGLKPFVAIYSTFLQRGYDSIVHDIALQNLPVKILVDRAGISHGDGATHHGIFDVSFLSHIPGIEIFSPVTYESLQRAVKYAAESTVPVAIRYSNTNEPSTVTTRFSYIGKTSDWIKTDFDISSIKENLFITYGNIASTVVLAADVIKDDFGLDVGVVLLERLKPYDELAKAILPYINNAKNIIFVEEGIKNGGAGMLLREAIASENPNFANAKYHIAAIEDNFAAPTHPCNIYDYLGLSVEALVQKMNSMIKEKEKNEH
jgi:1-deoxy-D-xylulose-5-phosphate synthase